MSNTPIGLAEEALRYVDPNDRDMWVRMAMAMKSEYGERGYEVWATWSRGSPSYKPTSSKATWKSVNIGGRIKIGSLFHAAKESGWVNSGLNSDKYPAISKARYDAQLAREKAEEDKQNARHLEAVYRSHELLKLAEPSTHNYLRSKQMPDETGLVLPEGALFIPTRNIKNELTGGQLIWWNYAKRNSYDIFVPYHKNIEFKGMMHREEGWIKMFIPGTRAKTACFRLGSNKATQTILCEGYATGVTIYMAARMIKVDVSVLVCFSAGNLTAVARIVKGRCGAYADHDPNLVGEEACKRVRIPYVMSDTIGFDANDDLREKGIIHVANKCRQLCQNMK